MAPKRIVPAVFVGTVCAAVVGMAILPSHREIALMHMKDLDFSEAFKSFSTLLEEGDHSIDVLAPLVNLNIYYGDIDKAISLLETYVQENPRTIEGRKRLAALYRASQRFNNYCRVLEDLEEVAPSTEVLRELADTYDFLGRRQDETKALARLIESKGYKPSEDDYVKLATFYRAENEIDKASDVMIDYIEGQKYKVKVDAVYLTAGLLLEKGDIRDARSLAHTYMKKTGKTADAFSLAEQFENKGEFDASYEILTPYLSESDLTPTQQLQIVGLLLAQKKDDEAYQILDEKYKNGTLPIALLSSLLDLAAQHKDYDKLDDILRKSDVALLPEDVLLRYAGMAIQTKRPEIAEIIHEKLGPAYLHDATLLNLALNNAAHDTPETLAPLIALKPEFVASAVERIVVANIYLMHGLGKKAFELLQSTPVADILDTLDSLEVATLYLDAGVPMQGKQLLVEARSSSAPRIQNIIDGAVLLLDVGQGKADAVHDDLKAFSEPDINLFGDALDIANNYHREEIAIDFARKLYELDANFKNRLQLAEALLHGGKVGEALKYLQLPADADAASRTLYLETVTDWVEKAGIAQLPEAQKAAFQKLLVQATQAPGLTPTDKLNLAYLLSDIGLYGPAENMFIKAAGDGPYGAHEVSELLAFWQDHPSPQTVVWMSGRARAAIGPERVTWLNALNEMEYPQAVLDVVGNDWNSSPGVADQYIAALVATHDEKRLGEVLDHTIAGETDHHRLHQLAEIAEQEDVTDAAEKAWKKLAELDPNDSEASLHLGMLAYDNNHFDMAEPLLARYLEHNQGDYRVNYAYGDILQQSERKSDAQPYFERALSQLSEIKYKNDEMQLDEAYLLFYTGKVPQSISAFHQLLAKNPNDKNLRANLAELLMEAGLYDDASRLLAQ